MLVTDSKVEHDIPHEPGKRMTFRCLSGAELDEAERIATNRIIEMVRDIDLSNIARRDDVADTDRRQTQYDADTLIQCGIVAWNYVAECNEDNKRQLDATTRNWARDVILDMNVRTEAEREN